ncbi:MAG: hypothetical protein Q8K75_12735 [Chlamydiales bacterium]|nr:hypothetical protein [Chlamydiales bacterium]
MNKFYMSLALLFCCCCGIINAGQNVNIATELQAPFDELSVSDSWVHLLVNVPEVVAFDYSDDVGVSFVFVEFPLLQEYATLDTLQHQIIQWMDGETESIPMLTFAKDDQDNVDEVRVDDLELDAKFEINEMHRMEIKGMEWLQVSFSRIFNVVYYHRDGDQTVVDTVAHIPEDGETYFTILNDRLYYAEFSAPPELYRSFKPVFLETMQNL